MLDVLLDISDISSHSIAHFIDCIHAILSLYHNIMSSHKCDNSRLLNSQIIEFIWLCIGFNDAYILLKLTYDAVITIFNKWKN